jgi:hypothetical protein
MNLQLASTEEWIDGKFAGNLGEVLIRLVEQMGTSMPLLSSNHLHNERMGDMT